MCGRRHIAPAFTPWFHLKSCAASVSLGRYNMGFPFAAQRAYTLWTVPCDREFVVLAPVGIRAVGARIRFLLEPSCYC